MIIMSWGYISTFFFEEVYISTHVKETLSHLSDDRLFRNLNALDLFVGSFTIPDEGLLVLCTDWFNLG